MLDEEKPSKNHYASVEESPKVRSDVTKLPLIKFLSAMFLIT